MKTTKQPKQTYSVTYKKNKVPLSIEKVKQLIKDKQLSGFIESEGTLDTGDAFCKVYLIIKQPSNETN